MAEPGRPPLARPPQSPAGELPHAWLQQPLVAIVVLNYENAPDTSDCLDSLVAVEYPSVLKILVDNGSSPETVRGLEEALARHPDVEWIRSERNLGYAAGNNLGIAAAIRAGARYVLILNSDTLVSPGFLGPLVAALESDPMCAIAMPRLIGTGGRDITPLRQRPLVRDYFLRFGILGIRARRIRRRGAAADRRLPDRVDVPCGACMLLRVSFLEEIGLLDEGTFLYQEEFILAEQMLARGLHTRLVQDSSVIHHVGRSTSRMPYRRMIELWRSQNYYLRKYRNVGPFTRGALLAYQASSAVTLNAVAAVRSAVAPRVRDRPATDAE